MSGILDNKQRILDTIVTSQGKQEIAQGKFKIKYVTFTDGGTYYKPSIVSGSEDATNRILFECSNLPQDQITFLADDSGKLIPLLNHSPYDVTAGKIFVGSGTDITFITGSNFSSTAETLLGSSIDNFQKLLTIGSIDTIFEDAEFQLSQDNVNFIITDNSPIDNPSQQAINISQLESFFADKHLSNIPNFRYMPPINKVYDSSLDLTNSDVQKQLSSPNNRNYLGTYKPLGPIKTLSYDEIKVELEQATKFGNVKNIKFNPTTNKNSLAIQIFEMNSDTLFKLDVLEFGRFKSNDNLTPDRHVFFAGKVFLDDNGTHTFVKIFTLIFE